jgi:hypothetical protein
MTKLKTGFRREAGQNHPELPADLDQDLRVYAKLIKVESGRSVSDPARLIAPMLKRSMATDRAFRRFRRQSAQGRTL